MTMKQGACPLCKRTSVTIEAGEVWCSDCLDTDTFLSFARVPEECLSAVAFVRLRDKERRDQKRVAAELDRSEPADV